MLFKKNICAIILLLTLLSISISCDRDATVQSESDCNSLVIYPKPEQVDDGWSVAFCEEVGICPTLIVEMADQLRNEITHKLHSIVVIKNGKLIIEEYYDGLTMDNKPRSYNRETTHYQASVSKSITSALVGIAFDKGLLTDQNAKISSYYPQYTFWDDVGRSQLTLFHLLSMASGLDWDEWSYPYSDSRNDVTGLFISSDPIQFVLQKPMHALPGEVFRYNSGVTNVLGDIVNKRSGKTLTTFAREYLFTPLGIEDFMWEVLQRSGVVFASGGLHLRPRDMAKIGQMYLQNGKWKNEQVISEFWITESKKESIGLGSSFLLRDIATGYGYQWWKGRFSFNNTFTYFAAGWGDQYIFVIPDYQMVVVITGGYYYDGAPMSVYDYIINDFILPSIFN